MSIEKQIFDYLKEHSHSSVRDIASASGIEEIKVLHIINKLCKKGYVSMNSPVPLSPNNDCSNYYSAAKLTFEENDIV